LLVWIMNICHGETMLKYTKKIILTC
jgi:hypothetical protein